MLCLFMSGLLYISIKIHHLPYRKISSFYISAFGFLYFMDSSGIVNDLFSSQTFRKQKEAAAVC